MTYLQMLALHLRTCPTFTRVAFKTVVFIIICFSFVKWRLALRDTDNEHDQPSTMLLLAGTGVTSVLQNGPGWLTRFFAVQKFGKKTDLDPMIRALVIHILCEDTLLHIQTASSLKSIFSVQIIHMKKMHLIYKRLDAMFESAFSPQLALTLILFNTLSYCLHILIRNHQGKEFSVRQLMPVIAVSQHMVITKSELNGADHRLVVCAWNERLIRNNHILWDLFLPAKWIPR